MARPAAEAAVPKTAMIDATSLKAHRTATSWRSKKGGPGDLRGRLIGRSSRGMVIELMTAGQVRDHMCPAALPGNLPKAEWLLADRGHDANWFEEV